jgi:FAD/FMN-containing dehydrogenase
MGSDMHVTILDGLREISGHRFVTDEAYELWCYTGYNLPRTPRYVARPASTEEIVRIVQLAREHRIPIIPRGLASRATPAGNRPYPQTEGGIILDMTRMRRIRDVNPVTMTVTAEAGLTIAALSTELVKSGYRIITGTLAPFCATLGSITGNGPGAIKYGTRQEQVVDLEVVLGTGEVLQTEPAVFGALMGGKYGSPNLTELFVKARGTLGIITAVTFYMHALPASVSYRNYGFRSTKDTVAFLLKVQEEGVTHLPGVFEVYVWSEHTLQLYKNNSLIREQNEDFRRLLDSFPPYPADVVGIVIEGSSEQVALEEQRLDELARQFSGIGLGPEPARDHYADCIWSGNTKAHEDSNRMYDTFAEPHFETQIDCYEEARSMTARIAEELGFSVGERYWRGSRLSRRMLTHSAAVTFNDLDPGERERAGMYYTRVLAEAARYKGMGDGRIDPAALRTGRLLRQQIKGLLDPDDIMYPGVEVKEE